MKRFPTMDRETAKSKLLTIPGSRLENAAGFCVFVDPEGGRHYVFDEEASKPALYKDMQLFCLPALPKGKFTFFNP